MGPPPIFLLLSMLAGGGASDLLDHVSTDYYWNQKQVAVSLQTMSDELKPIETRDISNLIADLDSTDPQVREAASKKIEAVGPPALAALKKLLSAEEQESFARANLLIGKIEANSRPMRIRRLMAIRALGESGYKNAIPLLEPLLTSDDMFVADYAREAIGRINGKQLIRKRPFDLRDDAWMMPQDCRAVGQLCFPPQVPDVRQFLKDVPMPPGMDRQVMRDQMSRQALFEAETVGNMRIDSITVGLAADMTAAGFITVIGRGRYDSKALAAGFRKQQMKSVMVGKTEVFRPTRWTSVLLPSDERLVIITTNGPTQPPTEEMIDNLRAKTGKLKNVPEMAKLLEGAPPDQPVWLVAQVTPSYGRAPLFAPFKTITISTQSRGDAIRFTIAGEGTNELEVNGAVKTIEDAVRRGLESLEGKAEQSAAAKSVLEQLETVKAEARGTNATLTGSFKPQTLMTSLPMALRPAGFGPPPPPRPR